jgi:uncharacterized delta-60 repeat protein
VKSIACLTVLAALFIPGTAQAAVAGDPDNSFSGDGLLSTGFNSSTGLNINDLAVGGDGKLVVVGTDSAGDIRVARLNEDGSFDSSFGGDGDVAINAGTVNDVPFSVAIDPATGNILVLGTIQAGGNIDLFLARLLPGGDLDPAFDGPSGGGNGVFGLNFGDFEGAGDIIADDDKVVFTANVTTTLVARIVRLQSNGDFDTSFNSLGFFDFQWSSGAHSFAAGLAQQDDGKYIVAGQPNGASTYGVARVTTTGALDGTFNPSGATPGIARPPLPPGFIDAGAAEVVVDPDGITVAGGVEAEDTFDGQPMLSRVTFAGAPDATFGTDGFAVLPLTATNSEAFTGLSALGGDGYLAGGISGALGPPEARTHLFGRFTESGSPDPSFSGDGYVERNPDGTSSRGLAFALSPTGVAYLAGPGSSFNIAVSAVCGRVPPACPGPETPDILSFSPASGGNANTPRVIGSVPSGPEVTQVRIYKDAACSGPVAGSGTEAEFNAPGIQVSVPDNSTTAFHAQAIGVNGPSPCSSASSYTEVTPAPPPSPPAAKKCKKGRKLKKGKCVKKKKKRKKR